MTKAEKAALKTEVRTAIYAALEQGLALAERHTKVADKAMVIEAALNVAGFNIVKKSGKAAPKADADFIVTQQGSVFTFDINTEAALAFIHSDVRPEAWQFLGKHRFAVDHRVAPDLCYQLREDGFNVVVR